MPQMAPMSWMIMYYYFILMFMFMMIKIYFNKNYLSTLKNYSTIVKKKNWKW
nr:ATP synthase F0 subunit 8 [Orthomeria smaragdinum]